METVRGGAPNRCRREQNRLHEHSQCATHPSILRLRIKESIEGSRRHHDVVMDEAVECEQGWEIEEPHLCIHPLPL